MTGDDVISGEHARLHHASCLWEQRGPCVYCSDHDVLLYQGTVTASPESRAALSAMFEAARQRLSEAAPPGGPEVHKPFTDDGVTYCGWDKHEGCGELWPCSTVRASVVSGGSVP